MKFFQAAIRTSGKKVRGAVGAVNKRTKQVANLAGKVPTVGPALAAVVRLQTSPIDLAARITSGQRIDKAVLGNLRQKIRDVKEVMPYVQTVIAGVPAVGPGVSAALGAGVALASGQPVSEILIAAARGAIPGGPLAAAAFDVTTKAVQGKGIEAIMSAGKALPAKDRNNLEILAGATKAAAEGKWYDEAAALRAQAALPPNLSKAASVGLAMAVAQKKQATTVKSITTPAVLNQLANKGLQRIKKDATLKAGAALTAKASLPGYKVGVALMGTQAEPTALKAVRSKLNDAQQKGFDLALSAHIGAVTAPAPRTSSAKAAFAYNVTMGARTMGSSGNKQAVIKTVAADPAARAGVALAVQTAKDSWLKRLWNAIRNSLR